MSAPTNGLVTGLVTGALAGAAGAAVVVLTLSPRAGEGAQQRAVVPAARDAESVADEVRALREETLAMARRLDELELRAPTGAPARVSQTPAEDLEELRELAASLQDPATPLPTLQRAVDRALELRQAEEDAEREQLRAEERERRIDERVADLTEKLGLDLNQSRSMRDVLFDLDQKRDEAFRALRESPGGFDREAARTTFTTMREEHDTQVQALLTPQQWEDYEADNESRFGGFRGGFGRGGGGSGGGRGD